MPYTVRLNPREERLLEEAARLTGEPRSSVVREAILRYCTETIRRERRSPYDAVAPFVGAYRSGRGDLSTGVKRIVRERLLARRKGPR